MPMPLRSGVHAELEAAADEMLRVALKDVTRHADKADILTPWKEASRRSREVYVTEGVPDGSVRRGNFHRSWNPSMPHLNSVEGFSPPKANSDATRLETGGATSVWDTE